MLEMVDVLANEKNVEKSAVFGVLETALASAVKKAQFPGEDADVVVSVDRGTGDWTAKRRWVVVSGDEGLQQPDREEMLSDVIDDYPEIKVGDYIDGQNASGTVKEIQIFHTILATTDNRIIYVPNGALSSNAITNYSKQEMRRAEWVFGVEYGEDFEKVKAVLERIIAADTRILTTPAPFIGLGALSASSVDIKVRVWTKTENYWDVYFDMNKIVYDTFNKEGIGFPFPQLTVHQAKD